MKKRIKSIIAASLSLVLVFSMTGCGSKERMEAEINPDTPVEDVEFPLKEKAELSFITSAPATSTQDIFNFLIFIFGFYTDIFLFLILLQLLSDLDSDTERLPGSWEKHPNP